MRNTFLSNGTARDIDRIISKVLNDLGNPEPPLNLEEVRYLLKLDMQFYSSTDDGVLREFVHKLTIAGKQLIDRPSLLIDVIKKWNLQALFLPDRRRILIDASLPEVKWRWSEGHEINHSLIPWHRTLMLGDDKTTLTPACHEQLEAEANYGTGRLLFLRDQFDVMARSTDPCFESVRGLKTTFGNTLTNTLWRYVEQSTQILFGVVCVHPRYPPKGFDSTDPCKYYIRSRLFADRFSGVTELEVFNIIQSYCSWKKNGPLGVGEAILSDINGIEHRFRLESFSNTYEVLTLAVHHGPRTASVAVA